MAKPQQQFTVFPDAGLVIRVPYMHTEGSGSAAAAGGVPELRHSDGSKYELICALTR